VLIESVPNVSEGRRPEVIARLAAAIAHTPGVRLLDYSGDASHHRSVFTLAGDRGAVGAAVLSLFEQAIASIDLRTHRGEHPRIGAVDVVPFVPLAGTAMRDCVALARDVGSEVAARFGIPVYLYEEAAANPTRRPLEAIRRGGFEGLATKMTDAAWQPDFGPAAPHPTAGAVAIGARRPLIAYNINLATGRLEIAKAIAAAIRTSGGGLPSLKALGLSLAERGIVQVSMNLTNHEETPLGVVFERVREEAERRGVRVLESEIIGLVPEAALRGIDPGSLLLKDFSSKQVLEARLRDPASEAPPRSG
jgi:glutamate formiminotransferase